MKAKNLAPMKTKTPDLKKISDQELIQRLESLVQSERRITHLVLKHIQEVESRELYLEMGYDRMYSYLTKNLKYNEASAYRRLQAARLLNHVPDVTNKIESGALNLSQLTKVQKCIRAKNNDGKIVPQSQIYETLDLLENKNGFESDQILAKVFDLKIQSQEVIKPQKDDSVRIELSFTKEEYEIIQKSLSLLSHTNHENKLKDAWLLLAKKHIQEELGKKSLDQNKAVEAKELKTKASKSSTQRFYAKPGKRIYISKKITKHLFEKAGHRCEYVDKDTGTRCDCTYQLQQDHIVPLAKGGSNNIENLRVLCRAHNLHQAAKWGLSRPRG